ncbi:MAG: HEAT repeat domain-containing protein [Planctomycetota bacterium]|nr:HEAT repeat domain-containing protein [Planctomycetota bacterium]
MPVFPLRPRFRCLPATAILLALLFAAPPEALAKDDPAAKKPALKEAGRKNAIKGLRSKVRKASRSPYAMKKKPEVLKHLEALAALGGKEAGRAAMEAVRHPDAEVRDRAFDLIEREHDKSFTKPLAAMLEDKAFRRDFDARRRIAHALAVVADPDAVEPLASLIRFDEDSEVVAEAADALAGYATAPLKVRKPAVKRLVDLYSSVWNLKESVKTDHKDKIMKKEAQARYKVYGKSLRHALQSLTGRQLTRPKEWRQWWNENKKKKSWKRGKTP